MKVIIANRWKAIGIFLVAFVVTAAALFHVWANRQPIILRRQVFLELSEWKRLQRERRQVEEELNRLKSAPRLVLRAQEILGMHPLSAGEKVDLRKEGKP